MAIEFTPEINDINENSIVSTTQISHDRYNFVEFQRCIYLVHVGPSLIHYRTDLIST